MGSYADLRINDFVYASTKGDVEPDLMLLFTEADKRFGELVTHDDDGEPFAEPYREVMYVTSRRVAMDRLRFYGYTSARVRELFESGIRDRIAEIEERIQEEPNSGGLWSYYHYAEELDRLRSLTYEAWAEGMRFIIATYRERMRDLDAPPLEGQPEIVPWMLSNGSECIYGYPAYDGLAFMYAALEAVDESAELIYDLTDLVASEVWGGDEPHAVWARQHHVAQFAQNAKLIVLTEGQSDSYVLSQAMQVLYPHLHDYYSFMDFDVAKSQGSAGDVVRVVKAFIGAGVVNRTVALLDNDTAAKVALRGLQGVTLPPNIRVLHYPYTPTCLDYPTQGPQGSLRMDVNNLAGSIELYLGEDVLRADTGEPPPVQWTGWDKTVKQYQGEVVGKGRLLDLFQSKAKRCLENRATIVAEEWVDLDRILRLLIDAFN